ncbi:MAG: PQQ-dependent sugar dehydrogenase [Pyrinomonadaceae bacterium]
MTSVIGALVSCLRHRLNRSPRRYTRSLVCGAALVVLFAAHAPMRAATVPTAFIEQQVASGLSSGPTSMAFAPDGRLFVCIQTGALRVIENDVLLATPFMTLSVNSNGERGLLGIAFDPNFATNHFLYVYYTTATAPIHNRISRFTANGNVVVPGSEVVILDLNNLSSATNHNGGAIHFGADGKLYAGVGENANASNAQTFANLLGKMLRINPDPANLIPTDNPYFNDPNVTGVNKAIWALGLRNPFTFSFQPGTGRMFINDVGQNAWEEINEGIAHSNYGWSICEGLGCSGTPPTDYRAPSYVYNHTTGTPTGCAIVGGAFYNPPTVQYPSSYVGKFFFADLCTGFIRYIDPNTAPPIATSTGFATGLSSAVDLQVGPDGSLYYLSRGGGGVVFKIRFPSNSEKYFDFDNDGKTDIAVWRADTGVWYILRSSDGALFAPQWGASGDQVVPGDYDGDGKTDVAVFRQSNGTWYIRRSLDGALRAQQWGLSGDTPVPGDYDADGKTDIAVFRPSTATWYVFRSSTGTFTAQQWGLSTDTVAQGDYDGDGRTDLGVFRGDAGFFYILRSSNGTLLARQWGANGDKPVPNDYDNDGTVDVAVWRPSDAVWYISRSSDGGLTAIQWGVSTDALAPGDYDGDGKTDLAVWRPSTGIFHVLKSSDGSSIAQQWGNGSLNDVAVPSAYTR